MNRQIRPLVLAALAMLAATTTAAECNQKILSYYGLTGSARPSAYKDKLADMNINFCPKMKSTCCLAQDFNLSAKLWLDSSKRVSKVLHQYFAILQNMAVSQRLISPFLPNLLSVAATSCKRIDTSFFRNPIPFDQLTLPIKAALETFAYLQRSFYCMICNANNQPYFEAGEDYGRLMIAVDKDFCPALIDNMRDFLNFKVYYFDPMVINMNAVIDCSNGVDGEFFDMSYRVAFDRINECLTNGENCESLCNEFRFGATSNLFIGKLSEYRRILENFHRVILKYNPHAQIPVLDPEVTGDVKTEFFGQTEFKAEVGPLNYNLSRYDVLLKKRGVNPFEESVEVKYEYVMREGQQATVTNFMANATITEEEVQTHQAVETGDKLAQLEANDLLPQSSEITSMNGDLNSLEADFEKKLQEDAKIDPNDVSRAGIDNEVGNAN